MLSMENDGPPPHQTHTHTLQTDMSPSRSGFCCVTLQNPLTETHENACRNTGHLIELTSCDVMSLYKTLLPTTPLSADGNLVGGAEQRLQELFGKCCLIG